MKNKKASVNWSVFLEVVTIAASFLIILFLYYQFYWKGEINKQTCHESVILKASMPNILDRKSVDLPLRCKTEKICITNKFVGGECEGFAREKNINNVRVSGNKEKQLEKIKEIIANSIYDCWSMMGEGKVNVFSRAFEEKKYSSKCVICARIDFDKELKEELKGDYSRGMPGISLYLDNKEIPNKGMNYSEFLTGARGERPYSQYLDANIDNFRIEQQAIVFQEFDRTTIPEDLTGAVSGIAAGAGVGYLTRSPQLSILSFFGGGYAGRKGGALIGGIIGDSYIASWTFVPYKAGYTILETEFVKSIKRDKGICYAVLDFTKIAPEKIPEGLDKEKNVYGFGSGGFVRGKIENWIIFDKLKLEPVNFTKEEDKFEEAVKTRNFLNQVLEELTIKCYDLKAFQCDDFESFV